MVRSEVNSQGEGGGVGADGKQCQTCSFQKSTLTRSDTLNIIS